MSKVTLKEMMIRFPNSFFDQRSNEMKLQSKDAEEWDDQPVCMNLNCRHDDLNYVGKNKGYGVYVYECDKCKTISLQGYEYKECLGAGNVGSVEDTKEID